MSQESSFDLRLFGKFEVWIEGKNLAPVVTPCARRLLAYLSWKCAEQISREVLIDQLWGALPPERGKRALNTALWRLRRALRDQGHKAQDYVHSTTREVCFGRNRPRISDVVMLEKTSGAVTRVAVEDASAALLDEATETAADCRGAFLPCQLDEWSLMPREVQRNRYAAVLEFLVLAHMKRRDWSQAISHAQHLIDLDPMQERAHQWLITCYLNIGDRLRAKSQYQACADLLRRELDVSPLPETVALIHRSAGAMPAVSRGSTTVNQARATLPKSKIKSAIDSLDAARAAILQLKSDIR